jgi:glycosidase
MKGRQMKGLTDGNDIPIREAFEWTRSGKGKGMALWYKDTGPWWDSTNIKANDGISFEEQKDDPGSLWNHYKKLLQLKKSKPALSGNYATISNDNDRVFSFLRSRGSQRVLVVVNLSEQKQNVSVKVRSEPSGRSAKGLWRKEDILLSNGDLKLELQPYGIQVFELD